MAETQSQSPETRVVGAMHMSRLQELLHLEAEVKAKRESDLKRLEDYNATHPEKVKARVRKYRQQHRRTYNEKQRAYRAKRRAEGKT
jgi:hypothetical protein